MFDVHSGMRKKTNIYLRIFANLSIESNDKISQEYKGNDLSFFAQNWVSTVYENV